MRLSVLENETNSVTFKLVHPAPPFLQREDNDSEEVRLKYEYDFEHETNPAIRNHVNAD